MGVSRRVLLSSLSVILCGFQDSFVFKLAMTASFTLPTSPLILLFDIILFLSCKCGTNPEINLAHTHRQKLYITIRTPIAFESRSLEVQLAIQSRECCPVSDLPSATASCKCKYHMRPDKSSVIQTNSVSASVQRVSEYAGENLILQLQYFVYYICFTFSLELVTLRSID